ncbi:MAG TPA: SBBP repeat-containing protein [Ignavibacteria bacterium]|nr:SBBP repeat-containing protein [Ignavibacteria bacterium]
MKTLIIKFLFLTFTILIYSRLSFAQVNEQWLHRYTGPESSTDTPSDIIIDSNGDFYMTGKSILSGTFSDIITVKFTADGTRQWISKFNGAANHNDVGNSITKDNSGNIYITGNSRITGGQADVITVKYNSTGVEQWTKSYNGTGNFDDNGIEILYDGGNYIYAAGYSFGTGTGYDFILLKYDLSGSFIWGKRWNGVSNSDDYLKKAAISADGNIILSGYSYKVGESNNYTVLKYDPSGNLIWERFYNGPSSAEDELSDMVLDNSNNIFVCGRSVGGIGGGYDYAMVKYNSAGTQQFVSRYNGTSLNDDAATGIALDPSGNIYVTGYSHVNSSFYDFATVKYNSSGTQQWAKTFNGSENYFDKAVGIKADANGNIGVTGNSIRQTDGTSDVVTIKYNTSGDVIWNKQYNGPGDLDDIPIGIELDNSGNFYVTAQSYSYFFGLCGTSDYLSIKYTSTGNSVFETRYDGSGSGIDESVDMNTDAGGNLYVTGYSYQTLTGLDYATIKYNPSGVPLWVSRYDNSGFDEKPSGIEVDNSGNSYIAGSSIGPGSGYDFSVIKYNTDGFLQWEKITNGSSGGNDYTAGITMDNLGNVFVTGHLLQNGSAYDIATIKYNNAGVQQWIKYYNGVANLEDKAVEIISDGQGGVCVIGKIQSTGTGEDIVVLKYSSSGNLDWSAVYNNNSSNDNDIPSDIKLDKAGNIYVCGKSKISGNGFDVLLLKFNSAGNLIWSRLKNGTASLDDESASLSTDNNGNIYLSGSLNNTVTSADMTTIKYDFNGNLIWTRSFNGTSNSTDFATDLKTDKAGFVYTTGFCNDIITGLNFCTIKYTGTGIKVWEEKYNYSDNDSDKAAAVHADNEGNIVVTGSSKGIGGGLDFVTMKYNQNFLLDLTVLMQGYYNVNTLINVSDTVKVFLRNGSSPYSIIDSSKSVSDASGVLLLYFLNVQNDQNYYIVTDHRNTLETWSSTPIKFESAGMVYDYTNSLNKAFGNNLTLNGTKFCIFTGDVNKDDVIDITDLGIIDNASLNFLSGYIQEDVNGDSVADLSDLGITDNNSFNFISTQRP